MKLLSYLITYARGIYRGQDIILSEANKQICEAVGCFAQATEKIQVKVGEKGTICLFVCSNCVAKFAADNYTYEKKGEILRMSPYPVLLTGITMGRKEEDELRVMASHRDISDEIEEARVLSESTVCSILTS